MNTPGLTLFTPPSEPALNDFNPLDDGQTLCHDVTCILLEVHRDRDLSPVFDREVSRQALENFAAVMARRLAPVIGGRYIPKRDGRAARDAALWKEFNGRNHKEMMRKFNVSRTLLYSILARQPRRASLDPAQS